MNTNKPLFISRCKNGFFVRSAVEDAEFSDLLADGMVFQKFYELLQFLNSHFPEDEKDNKQTAGTIIIDKGKTITIEEGSRLFLEDVSEDSSIDLVATRRHVLSVHRPDMCVCIYDPWSLNAFSSSYEGLIESMKEQIIFLWKTYVREEDEKLSAPAIAVKQRLMEDWKEVERV